jgi:hypothetical protein
MQLIYFPSSDDVSVGFEIKKYINHKPNIKIKSYRIISFHTIKTLKQDPTCRYLTNFLNLYLLINIIYYVQYTTAIKIYKLPDNNICTYRTSYMNCRNKYVYVSNKSVDVTSCSKFKNFIINRVSK